MPLSRQHVDVRLGSLDTNVDDKTAPVGVMKLVQNAVRDKVGRYRKRSGRMQIAATATNIPPGGNVVAPWQLAPYKGRLVKLDASNSNALQGMANVFDRGQDAWIRSGQPTSGAKFAISTHMRRALTSQLHSIYGADAVPANPDIAFIPGTDYAVCVFDSSANSGTIIEAIFDATTNQIVTSQAFLGYRPKVQNDGVSTAYVAYVTAGFINTREWTAGAVLTATPATTGTAALPAVGAAARCDLQQYGATVMFAYLTTTPNVEFLDISVGGSGASGSLTADADQALGWLKDDGASGRYLLATASTATGVVRLNVIDTGGLVTDTYAIEVAIAAGYVVANLCGFTINSDATGNFVLLYDYISTIPYGPFNRLRMGRRSGVTLTTGTDLILSVSLRSKTWLASTRHYVVLAYDSNVSASEGGAQNVYFGFEVLDDPLAVATPPQNRCPILKIATGTANGRTETPTGLTDIALRPGTSTLYGGLVIQRNVSAVSDVAPGSAPRTVLAGVSVAEFTFSSTLVGRPVEFADSLIVPLGVLSHFDGRQLAELGFNLMPEQPSGSIVVGGGALSAGVYSWAFLYRRTDGVGRTHRGPPAFSAPSTVALNDALSWDVISLKPTGREASSPLITPADDMAIETYRTLVNGEGFQLANVRTNDRTVDTVNVLEGDPDDSVALATQLYTTGDVLENVSPPQLKCLTVHRERLFGVNADDPEEVWYTKADAAGEGPRFNDVLTFRCPEAVTAMASMDDKLVLFSAASVFVVTGDGPNDLGENTYPPPQRIVSGVGCLLPRSLVYTPDGLWFHSPKGIYILTRGLDAMFAGAPVTDYTSTTNDAIHVKASNQVRFYQDSGNCLVYDYHFKEWWLWTGQNARAAAQVGDSIYTADSLANFALDDSVAYDDAGTNYRFLISTSWISMGGISGFQRLYEVQIVGEHIAACFARMSMYYDYSDVVAETRDVESSSPFDFSLRVARQKCPAFRVDVMDDDGAGAPSNGAAFSFSGIALDVGVKAPLNKLASAKRMT